MFWLFRLVHMGIQSYSHKKKKKKNQKDKNLNVWIVHLVMTKTFLWRCEPAGASDGNILQSVVVDRSDSAQSIFILQPLFTSHFNGLIYEFHGQARPSTSKVSF